MHVGLRVKGSTLMSGPLMQTIRPAGPYGIRRQGSQLTLELGGSWFLSDLPRPGPTCKSPFENFPRL
ncbi:protein of unknown function [Burkholderia multivorans]